jgi:hypothetical protein
VVPGWCRGARCRVLPGCCRGAAGVLPGCCRVLPQGAAGCCRELPGCEDGAGTSTVLRGRLLGAAGFAGFAGLPGCRVGLSGPLPGLCSGCQVARWVIVSISDEMLWIWMSQ